MVATTILGVNAGTWGVNTTYEASFLSMPLLSFPKYCRYGVYNSFYVENNYFDGGSPLRYAFVGGLSVGMAFVCAPIANFLMKSYGFRCPLIIGTVCMVLGQALAGVWQYFGAFLAFQGIVFGIGLGLVREPAIVHYDLRLTSSNRQWCRSSL